MLQVGDQFDHFQIQSQIAQGITADIFAAIDVMTGKPVVIKLPNERLMHDPTQAERFRRELEVMKTLTHPAIQRGLESGLYNRTPYLVTEYIEGKSLREVVSEATPMAPVEAVALIRKIAEGLAYCHANAVVHRDMKPDNVLITTGGQPIILDFGLALTKDARRVTFATTVAGTPDYMAPEQCEGGRGDARTDIYALGIMLYELLTGKTPFAAESSMVTIAGHLQGAIPHTDKDAPGVSTALAAVITKALQKNPDERYPSMQALIEALDAPALMAAPAAVASERGAMPAPAAPQPTTPGVATPSLPAATPDQRARRALLLMVAILVLMGAGVIAFLVFVAR
jgi:serine/threonine-protein kinase